MIAEKVLAYCETTSIHGFSYWVSADRRVERLFWICVVTTFLCCASVIIRHS